MQRAGQMSCWVGLSTKPSVPGPREALGDPRPAPPELADTEEVGVEFRSAPDPEEELRRFREEIDRMLRGRSDST
jgi:hypothetical protein